jgi:site-specific DNA recombinase
MKQTTGVRKLGLYVRVSSDNQVTEEGSLKSQKQRLEEEVTRRNHGSSKWGTIVQVYVEEAKSGKDTNRPEFLKMLQDVRRGTINTIMVTELSRLSRSVSDFLQILSFLEKYNADFVCPQYNFDTTSPSGRVFLTIIVSLAQFEREMVSERVKNNLKARTQRGLYNGGPCPLGFKTDPLKKGYLFPDDDEIPIVKEIFNAVLEIGSIRQAARELNQKGFRTKRTVYDGGRIVGGVPFNRDSLGALLVNYAYIGMREVNRDNKDQDQSQLLEGDRYQVVKAAWDGIIDENLFKRMQDLIEHNRHSLKNYVRAYPYILSGIIKCQQCGENYVGISANGRNDKYFYYSHKSACKNGGMYRFDAATLEEFVLKRMKTIATDRELLALLVDESNKQNIDQIQHTESLWRTKRNELAELGRSADALIDKMISLPKEVVDSSFIQKKLKEFESRKVQLEAEIDDLAANKTKARDSIVVLDEIRKVLLKVLKNFKNLSVPLQRDLLRLVVCKIVLSPTQIKLVLYGKTRVEDLNFEDNQLLTSGSYVGGNGSSGRI